MHLRLISLLFLQLGIYPVSIQSQQHDTFKIRKGIKVATNTKLNN